MSKTYAYTFEEALPVLMQAIRFHTWQDPGDDVSGREERCEAARKVLARTGALPVGMAIKVWRTDCSEGTRGRVNDPLATTGINQVGAAANTSISSQVEWVTQGGRLTPDGASLRARRRRTRVRDPPEGNGLPGQWTRWAGFG